MEGPERVVAGIGIQGAGKSAFVKATQLSEDLSAPSSRVERKLLPGDLAGISSSFSSEVYYTYLIAPTSAPQQAPRSAINPTEDWANLFNLAVHIITQNCIAQHNSRKKLKRRLEDHERLDERRLEDSEHLKFWFRKDLKRRAGSFDNAGSHHSMHNPNKSHQSHSFPLVLKHHFVEGEISGTLVEAFPDSGAAKSFISPNLASRLRLPLVGQTRKQIRLADGRFVQSPGMVKVPWMFRNERTRHALNCWILPGCVHGLILGSPFLRATETLSTFKHRIKSRWAELSNIFRVRLLGEEKQRLLGTLNGHLTAALADTGSDIMAISREYALKLGLTIEGDGGNWLEVEFADGKTGWTSGIVRDVSWAVGGKPIRYDFHVLDDLCTDVILSKDYVFDMDVFSEHSEHFISLDAQDFDQLCNIRLIGRYGDALNLLEEDYWKDVTSPDAFSPQKIQMELARRDQIRDEILGLPESEREVVARAEAERQRRWEQLRSQYESIIQQPPSDSNGIARAGGNGRQVYATIRRLWRKRPRKVNVSSTR